MSGRRTQTLVTAVSTATALLVGLAIAAGPASAAAHPSVTNVAPNAGPAAGGNDVVVSGTGFTQVSFVLFGTTRATNVTVNSATQLTAVAPKHSLQRTDIKVVTKHGTSAVVRNLARYTYIPAPRTLITERSENNFYDVKSMACTSASFCAAVDDNGYADVFEHGVWQTATLLDDNFEDSPPMTLSCASSTLCFVMEVGVGGHVYRWDGTTWGSAFDIAGFEPGRVSCVSQTFCEAVNGDGQATTYNGHSWSTPIYVSPGTVESFEALSCPTVSFCMAVGASPPDNNGNQRSIAIDLRNGRWDAAAQTIDPNYVYGVRLSCPQPHFCAVGTTSGVHVWTGGAGWSAVLIPAASQGQPVIVSSVTCSNATFCLALWRTNYQSPLHWVRFDGASTANQSFVADGGFPYLASCWDRYQCRFAGGGGTNYVTS